MIRHVATGGARAWEGVGDEFVRRLSLSSCGGGGEGGKNGSESGSPAGRADPFPAVIFLHFGDKVAVSEVGAKPAASLRPLLRDSGPRLRPGHVDICV